MSRTVSPFERVVRLSWLCPCLYETHFHHLKAWYDSFKLTIGDASRPWPFITWTRNKTSCFFPWKVAPHSPLVPIVRLSRVISSLWRLVQVVSWFDVTGQLTNKRERIFQFSSTLAFDTVVPYLTKAYMGIVRPQLAGISRFNHVGPKTWCL